MQTMYYIGLDVHKKTISYCVKDGSGRIHAEGTIPATRLDLDIWMKALPQPWTAAMEATIFTSWIYRHLLPHATAVKVGHPLMLRAIAAAKKKNDRIDAGKICDCLRCDFQPECHMASAEIRERAVCWQDKGGEVAGLEGVAGGGRFERSVEKYLKAKFRSESNYIIPHAPTGSE